MSRDATPGTREVKVTCGNGEARATTGVARASGRTSCAVLRHRGAAVGAGQYQWCDCQNDQAPQGLP